MNFFHFDNIFIVFSSIDNDEPRTNKLQHMVQIIYPCLMIRTADAVLCSINWFNLSISLCSCPLHYWVMFNILSLCNHCKWLFILYWLTNQFNQFVSIYEYLCSAHLIPLQIQSSVSSNFILCTKQKNSEVGIFK